jgi:flagellar motor switch protein FliM
MGNKPQTNSENSQKQLEKASEYKLSDIQKELITVTELIDLPICDIMLAEEKLKEMFEGKISKAKLLNAIKEGALGKYGSSYRLDIQEIGRWVFQSIKNEKEANNGRN